MHRDFCWTRMVKNVFATVRDYSWCAQSCRTNKKQRKPRRSPPSGPLEYVAMDILGLLPIRKCSNQTMETEEKEERNKEINKKQKKFRKAARSPANERRWPRRQNSKEPLPVNTITINDPESVRTWRKTTNLEESDQLNQSCTITTVTPTNRITK